jgi:hypothetical protein
MVGGVVSPLLLVSVCGNDALWGELLGYAWCDVYSVCVVYDSYLLLIGIAVPSDYQLLFWFHVTDIMCQYWTLSLLLCVS